MENQSICIPEKTRFFLTNSFKFIDLDSINFGGHIKIMKKLPGNLLKIPGKSWYFVSPKNVRNQHFGYPKSQRNLVKKLHLKVERWLCM